MKALIIVGIALSLVGCGKTVKQMVKAGQELVGVVGEAYEDGKENVKTAKDVVVGEEKK